MLCTLINGVTGHIASSLDAAARNVLDVNSPELCVERVLIISWHLVDDLWIQHQLQRVITV